MPLELLQTKYAKSYQSLIEDLDEYIEWFMIQCSESGPPYNPDDMEENRWRANLELKIMIEEMDGVGGLFDQAEAALIDNLDRNLFDAKCLELRQRLQREVWEPYIQHFNG